MTPPLGAVARAVSTAYGTSYDNVVDLDALRRAHKPAFTERTDVSVDGNTAGAIPFLQWWRAPLVAGFPITPSTKWLEHLAAECGSGKFDIEINGKKIRAKRVKLLEAEHAVADYLVGSGASCRELIVGTATSSVGLDHMAETVRSLGASGLGNVMIVNVCRATANYPLCIEGDPSDLLAHRDSGFVQVMCRGRQQIYDTILQMPAVGMDPRVMTPTMPAYYGIKDSHRSGRLTVEADDKVNAFLDEALALGRAGQPPVPPGLLNGDTSLGNCVTSAFFQGFKVDQKARLQKALEVIPKVSKLFEKYFGRPGIELFEQHMLDDAEVALVCMGPDAGTMVQLLPSVREQLGVKVGLLIPRLLTPFPMQAMAEALSNVKAVGVVNNAFHHGRGHLTMDIEDTLEMVGRAIPVEAFFVGMGGADVSKDTWRLMAKTTAEAAKRGKAARRWHQLHDGLELSTEG